MTPRSFAESFPVLAIAKRLGLWLIVVAVYSEAVALAVRWWNLRPI